MDDNPPELQIQYPALNSKKDDSPLNEGESPFFVENIT